MMRHAVFITSEGEEVEVDNDAVLRRGKAGSVVARDAHPDMLVVLTLKRTVWEGKRKREEVVEVTASRKESDWRSRTRHEHAHGHHDTLPAELRVVSTAHTAQRTHTTAQATPKGTVRVEARGFAVVLVFGGGENTAHRNAAKRAVRKVVEARLLNAGLQDELVGLTEDDALVCFDAYNAQLGAWVAERYLMEQGWYIAR